VPVGLVDRSGRLPQVVELAQLVRHLGEHPRHSLANRVLPVGDDARDRHAAGVANLPEQLAQILLPGREQTLGQEDLAAEHVADDPQHLVPDVRLQPVDGQDHLPLIRQHPPQSPVVGEGDREQLVVAVQQVGDGALGDQQSTPG